MSKEEKNSGLKLGICVFDYNKITAVSVYICTDLKRVFFSNSEV